jgi:hypothetical protein
MFNYCTFRIRYLYLNRSFNAKKLDDMCAYVYTSRRTGHSRRLLGILPLSHLNLNNFKLAVFNVDPGRINLRCVLFTWSSSTC